MPNPDSIALAALAGKQGLEAVLVGGNAVNLHAYSRTTFDLDLLVPERDATKWLSFFEEQGYAVFYRTANFIRLRLAADPAGALPVDLMLSDEETFQKIKAHSSRRDLGGGISLAIPSVLHLIAMKLHAARSAGRREHGVDLQDVAHLIKSAKIDTDGDEFAGILERYGRMKYDAESEKSPTNVVREAASGLSLPAFDSIPADAGLSNVEAFRLSVQHALSLLPANLARLEPVSRNLERFRL